jgi:prepilin-type N-terminal cleavage/methylation domain-containing protein
MTSRNPFRSRRFSGQGFSLVELLCVLAILLILYSLYFSAGSKAYQRRQQEACGKNLQFIHQALRSYALDHQDHFPAAPRAATSEAPLSLLVPAATTRTEIFICPGSDHKRLPDAEPFEKRKISYAYLMGLDASAGSDQWLAADALVDLKAKAVGDALFASDTQQRTGNNHREFGGMVLFADGRAERSPPKSAFVIQFPSNSIPLNPRP